MACIEHNEADVTETSYLYSLDETGAIKAYGKYLNPDPLWPENMLFSAIAVDDEGRATLAGMTTSQDFPVTFGAFQISGGGGNSDAFVSRLDPSTHWLPGYPA